jgi:WD40 repeat protein
MTHARYTPIVVMLLLVFVSEGLTPQSYGQTTPELLVPTGHRNGLSILEISADDQYVLSGGNGGSLKVWDLASGYLVAEQRHSTRFGDISAATFAPSHNRVIYATLDGEVYDWTWTSKGAPQRLPLDNGKGGKWTGVPFALSLSDNGRYLGLGGFAGKVGVWDLRKNQFLWEDGIGKIIHDYRFGADRKIEQFFQRLNRRDRFAPFHHRATYALQRHDVPVEKEVEVIKTRAYRETNGFWGRQINERQWAYNLNLRVVDVAFRGSSEKLVVLAQNGDVVVFDGTGQTTAYHDLPTDGLSLSLSDNGKHAVVSTGGTTASVWNVQDGSLRWKREVADGKREVTAYLEWKWLTDMRSLRVSNGGRRVVTCLDNQVITFGRERATSPISSHPFDLADNAPIADCLAALTAQGDRVLIASSRDRLNYVFDFKQSQSGARVQRFQTAQAIPASLNLTSDAQVLLTGRSDHLLWSFEHGRVDATLQAPSVSGHIAYRPEDQRLYHYYNAETEGPMQLDAARLSRVPSRATQRVLSWQSTRNPSMRCETGPIQAALGSPLMLATCETYSRAAIGKIMTHMIAFQPDGDAQGPLIELPARDTLEGSVVQAAIHPYKAEAVTGSHTGIVRVWDLQDGESIDSVVVVRDLGGTLTPEARITALTYAPSGNGIAAAAFRTSYSGGDIVGVDPDRVEIAYFKKRKRRWLASMFGDYNRKADIELSEEVTGRIRSLTFNQAQSRLLAGTSSGEILIIDLDKERVRHRITGHTAPVIDVKYLPGEDRFISLSSSGEMKLWNADTRAEIVKLLIFDAGAEHHGTGTVDAAWIAITPDGYYTASKGTASLVGFRRDEQVFTFSQFDLRFNRPDIVLQRLGSDDEALLQAYRQAFAKRLEKMDVTEDMLSGDLHIPEVRIANETDVPKTTSSASVDLVVHADDDRVPLDRLNVWVNGVALFGQDGKSLRGAASQGHQETLSIPLSRGENEIEVSVTNTRGAESLRQAVYVRYDAPPKVPSLHVVSIGVSDYRQSEWNLAYAAKDARDLASLLASQTGRYDQIHTHLLTDADATTAGVEALRAELEATGIEDHVIVFAAGHGLVSDDLDYYFATHDTDFEAPEYSGLSYSSLEQLLDGIPARKKALLVDACHSGEIDADEIAGLSSEKAESGTVQFRTAGPILQQRDASRPSDFQMMRQLFVDLRRGTGATVVASSGGVQAALEGDQWKNGVFTYALLSGLSTGAADANADGQIMLSELKTYLRTEVPRLTNGFQTPTARSENRAMDFRIW